MLYQYSVPNYKFIFSKLKIKYYLQINLPYPIFNNFVYIVCNFFKYLLFDK